MMEGRREGLRKTALRLKDTTSQEKESKHAKYGVLHLIRPVKFNSVCLTPTVT